MLLAPLISVLDLIDDLQSRLLVFEESIQPSFCNFLHTGIWVALNRASSGNWTVGIIGISQDKSG